MKINNLVTHIPELQDQINLFKKLINEKEYLSKENKKFVAWATAIACQNYDLTEYVKSEVGGLSAEEKRAIYIASSRMSVTNPYFMGRSIHPLQAGGTLDALDFRPFPQLNVENEQGYHYACVAVSLINGGFVCFNSHITSLKADSQQDEAIDQALRLVASICSIKQLMFNAQID